MADVNGTVTRVPKDKRIRLTMQEIEIIETALAYYGPHRVMGLHDRFKELLAGHPRRNRKQERDRVAKPSKYNQKSVLDSLRTEPIDP